MHEESNFESSRPSASNEGHPFVVRSDLAQLRCDASLLPPDVFGHVTNGWLASESLFVVAEFGAINIPASRRFPARPSRRRGRG